MDPVFGTFGKNDMMTSQWRHIKSSSKAYQLILNNIIEASLSFLNFNILIFEKSFMVPVLYTDDGLRLNPEIKINSVPFKRIRCKQPLPFFIRHCSRTKWHVFINTGYNRLQLYSVFIESKSNSSVIVCLLTDKEKLWRFWSIILKTPHESPESTFPPEV